MPIRKGASFNARLTSKNNVKEEHLMNFHFNINAVPRLERFQDHLRSAPVSSQRETPFCGVVEAPHNEGSSNGLRQSRPFNRCISSFAMKRFLYIVTAIFPDEDKVSTSLEHSPLSIENAQIAPAHAHYHAANRPSDGECAFRYRKRLYDSKREHAEPLESVPLGQAVVHAREYE